MKYFFLLIISGHILISCKYSKMDYAIKLSKYSDDTCKCSYDSLLNKNVYTALNEPPSYINGNLGLLDVIVKNLEVNEYEITEGKIHTVFVIDETGKIIDVRFKKKIMESLEV